MAYESDETPLWPLLPNWKRGVDETLEFRTRIIGPTYTGLAQKSRRRIAPRRYFDFEVHPNHASRRLLENVRFAQGRKQWWLPIWNDRQRLAAALPAGETELPCATATYDFSVGGYVALRKPGVFSTDYEILQVESIEADHLVLSTATVATWGAGTFLYPVRRARLRDGSDSLVLLNSGVSTSVVSMEVAEPCDWSPHTFATTYLGYPVWDFRHNWSTPRNLTFGRLVDVVDNMTSLPQYFDFTNRVFPTLNGSILAKTRAQFDDLKRTLYALAGRYASVWVPTLAEDFKVVAPIDSADVTVDVEYCGYTLFCQNEPGRRDIAIELYDGTVYHRRIASSAEVSGTVERLTLNAALGADVPVAQVRRVSYLMLMQQSTDGATIKHLTDHASTTLVSLEGVVEP